jgi:3-oxoacyl-[acyl-carrier protein] reductase
MASLSGRVALITGATRGYGPAIARLLNSRGAVVALHDGGDPAAADALVRTIDPTGGQAIAVGADWRDPLSIQRMVDDVYRRLGRLDILVNAAEQRHEGALLAITPDEWQAVFAANVHGTFYAIQAAAKYMVLDRRGRVVNVSHLAGAYPGRGQAAYAATKGALNALTRALAVELAPKQITLNVVAPGAIVDGTEAGSRAIDRIPLKRLGTEEDVAEMVAFLASDDASYVTGEVFYVDGGLGGRR